MRNIKRIKKHGIAGTFLLAIFFNMALTAQDLNYREIFGDDWTKAEEYVAASRSWMEPLLEKNHIKYPFAVAVVFPELVRYSALRDKMEITLLKALYINLGDDYANFSVGRFQIKPSFANLIREQAGSALSKRSGIRFSKSSDYGNVKDYRKSIISDLEDPETEFRYLIAFIKICEKNYRIGRMDETEKLRFTATAYNSGIDRSAAEIESMSGKKFFNTKLFRTENYSYWAVSLFWYKNYTGKQPAGNKK